ncbi:hypothetical protein B0T16DRAFT_422729 [Cercophora newfieldiana]|uniref:Uncharacterized protein n=1 Tax=Cercophora newfieldiana TaxID=92897 RepID=A0AA40CHP3_9PEZI|nr:hypothetical protein B0T16DRAFT_422729 [Cercophora newfieldiana]
MFPNAGNGYSNMGYAAQFGGAGHGNAYYTGNAQMNANSMGFRHPAMMSAQPIGQSQPSMSHAMGSPSQQAQPMDGGAMNGNGITHHQQPDIANDNAPTQAVIPAQGNADPSQPSQKTTDTFGKPLPSLGDVAAKPKAKRAYKSRAKKNSTGAGTATGTQVPKVAYNFGTQEFTIYIRMDGQLVPANLGSGSASQLAKKNDFVRVVQERGMFCPDDFILEIDRSHDENIRRLVAHLQGMAASPEMPQ